jgi:hypothetical protein
VRDVEVDMLVLKRVGVGAAFKVGLVLGALLALVFGLIAFLAQAALLNALVGTADVQLSSNGQNIDPIQVMSLVGTSTLCFLYVLGVVFGALYCGISFAVGAFFYNLTARWVGGLEFETFQSGGGLLDEIEAEIYEKRKRS